ncbi:hypothetical protein [Actinomadura sp. HBU206391]|uniref:hypothetical protein n=1 Tax=Actinomadura sp. HBU206391 TaxID=2731692 RepID=UPI0016503D06|nr:hypothetical protein [Actinomadura sp. HBU206391]MBC6456360.1 hypothetical protein [Actinomadura sp. HBU206391]
MIDHEQAEQDRMEPTSPSTQLTGPHGPAGSPLPREGDEPNGQWHPSSVDLRHYGEHGIQAYNLHLNGDQAIPIPITETDADYKASQDGRFVPPRNTHQWDAASKLLDEYGIVVLCAAPGTGRRTAAVRLLRTATSSSLTIIDLDPEWSRPSVRPLPKEIAHGYILDLSDLPDQLSERLGADLVGHGVELRKKNSFLVILATPDDWYGHWAEPTLPFTIRLESPDARALVTAELRAHHPGDRAAWLDGKEFTDIWKANPSARAAWRLADRLIRASGADQIQSIVDEFGDWHTEVEKLLSKDRAAESDSQLLATRVTVWAGALLHGGQRSSVIKAADDLLTQLGFKRNPANVLTDATTSSRLKAAKITRNGDRAFHDTQKEGLPAAILRHLWDEFPTQHKLLCRWAIDIAADRTVPEEDARLVTTALLKLAVYRHDRAILDGLASYLIGPRRILAVEALTEAAGDNEFGRYVRDRLRQWMDAKTPSDNKVELVIEICGGTWGIHQPALAVTRLGKAAGHKEFGSATVVHAFQQLALRRPEEVRRAVHQWLSDVESRQDDETLRRQTLGAFLALVSSDEGTDLILDDTHDPETRLRIIHAWQKLLSTDDAVEAVVKQLSRWHERFHEDPDRREAVVNVLADIYTPPRLRSGLDRLMVTEESAIRPFWRDVLVLATNRYQTSKEASTP